MAINKSQLNHKPIDGSDAPPAPPPITGSGTLVWFAQWVVPNPKSIAKNAINRRAVNSPTLDGQETEQGHGTLIYFHQNVGAVGSGTEVFFAQSVGLKEGPGNLIAMAQNVIVQFSGAGLFITLDQNVVAQGVGSICKFGQRVIQESTGLSYPDHLTRCGWDADVFIGGIHLDPSTIFGPIKVVRSESQASTAELTIMPGPGVINVEAYTGKKIQIDVHVAAGTFRIYTGIIDIPEVDFIEKKILLRCTDDRFDQINTQLPGVIGSIGFFSTLIFRNVTDTADELDKRLSTTPYSVDFDAYGNYTITSWFPKDTPDYTFTDSDAYYTEQPKLTMGSRGRVINHIQINFKYRYQRWWQMERLWNWVSPIAQDVMLLLQYGYSLTFRERVKTAASSTGWLPTSPITFTNIWPSGWYNGIAWSTVALKGSTTNVTDSDGNIVLDSDGNPVTETTITGGTNYADLYCMGATFKMAKRWGQTISEEYNLIVYAPQSIAQYGEVDSFESYAVESKTDNSSWEASKSVTPPPTNAVNTLETYPDLSQPNTYYIDQDTNRDDAIYAMETVLAKAKTSILKSYRDTKVSITQFIFPQIDLSHTVKFNCSTLVAQGKVFSIEHDLDINNGEAKTIITLALFQSSGTTTDSILEPPTIPTDFPIIDTTPIPLGNHFGQDPTTPAAASWNGMIGNAFVGNNIFRTTYQEQFRVDTPPINADLRQERNLNSNGSSIPVWLANTPFSVGEYIQPSSGNGLYYICTGTGISGNSEPSFPTDPIGAEVADNTTGWRLIGPISPTGYTVLIPNDLLEVIF